MPIERDPKRVQQLAEAKREENFALRAFLKWVDLPSEEIDGLFHRLSEEVTAEIDCTECGNCCREFTPVLDEGDVARLARGLRVTVSQLETTHLEESEEGLVFARRPCPLLEGARCSCYEDRPGDCRSYPHLDKVDMTSRLLGVVNDAEVCPIVYNVLERLKAEFDERGDDWRDSLTRF